MRTWLTVLLCLLMMSPAAVAQDLRISRAISVATLVMIVAEAEHLVEKHAADAGIPNLKVSWLPIGNGPSVQIDELLSGSVDIISAGMTSVLTLWDKTRTNVDVRAITGQSTTPLRLVSRNPNVRSIADLADQDRIAVASVKISFPAMLLQMAAARQWGPGEATRLDRLTVTMPAADAATALMSGRSEITADFNSPPYTQLELSAPGVHEILASDDILGEKTNGLLTATTRRFHDQNPAIMKAFVAALEEACGIIRTDHGRAADDYLRATGAKATPRALILQVLDDPKSGYDITPAGTKRVADFMFTTHRINHALEKWQDLFFPDIQALPGS
jgi:NitT/TauT family transport system substrate-binding protein